MLPTIRSLLTLLSFSLIATPALAETQQASEAKDHGQFLGAKETVYPAWFKESFLELGADAEEAGESGKHVMILFHQAGCPYCNALVERNLSQKNIEQYVRQNFDVVAINMWGDREVLAVGGKSFSEKSFAAAMKVQFTPTLVFLDGAGNTVLRLNGYLPPERFLGALEYVAEKRTDFPSYNAYLASINSPTSSSALNHQDFFREGNDLSAAKGRVQAVFFEQKDCPGCDRLHQEVLTDPDTRAIVAKAVNTQLDMWSGDTVITPDGRKTTVRDWAAELNVKYAPTVILFDADGNEIIRSEAFFKTFHTAGIFDYALSGAYGQEPSFQRWLNAKAEHLRELGKDVNIWK